MLFKPFSFSKSEREMAVSEPDPRPLGVIDIGSNSVRIVVYEGALRAPTPIFNEKELCGLGKKIASRGQLADDAVECALTALRRFRAIADVLGVATLKVIATAAVRDAANGPQFIERAEALLRVPIDVLSGEEEATISARGVLMGIPDANGIAADLGGGSVELVDIRNGEIHDAVTLPLGGLRLIDVTGRRLERATEAIDREIAAVPWLANGRGRTFYAVGGTWRAFAKMHMTKIRYPLSVMHGYRIPAADAAAFARSIHTAKRFAALPGAGEISRARREILPYGAALLDRLIEAIKPQSVQVSVFGVREGILHSLLDERIQAEDPLLSYCLRLAELYSRDAQHAEELCAWTDPIFSIPALSETREETRLRHAACLISDIGWRGHPDYRDEQSLDAVAHSALSGIDHPGRIFLALSIYFRHSTRGGFEGERLSTRLKRLASKNDLARARIIGAAVRAAHMLSLGISGMISHTTLAYENGTLVWRIPAEHAPLIGKRLEKRFAALAELVGCRPHIEKT